MGGAQTTRQWCPSGHTRVMPAREPHPAHEVAHVLQEHLTCTRAVGSSEAEVGAEAAGRAGKPR